MVFLVRSSLILILAATSGGCVIKSAVTLAPGADQMKITTNPADVSGCAPVGNIPASSINVPDPRIAKNEALGLNANTVFNTGYGGVAYRCK